MIQFRPHHFMCTLGFCGHGYSIPFVENYQSIVNQLNQDSETKIKVIMELDSICMSCPHQTYDKKCSSQDLITELDSNHRKILKLKNNQILSWSQAKKIIKENMTIESFNQACENCEWKKLGVCEKALKNLLAA